MEHVSSVRPTGKFPEKVENLKRWSRFPGWNFRTECRVPLTFLVVCTSSRSTVGHPATYRGLRPNGTTFYRSEIPLLLPPKFPGFFCKWKAPSITPLSSSTLVPIIPLRRSRCFLSRFLLSLQCSSLSLGKPVEEAVNGEPPSTHGGINTIVNSVTTSHHGLTRITRKVENTERGSTIYN